jgi:hypothetical protein
VAQLFGGGLTRRGGKTTRETRRGEWNPMTEKRSGHGPVMAEVRCWLLLLTLLVLLSPPESMESLRWSRSSFPGSGGRGAARRGGGIGVESNPLGCLAGWLRCAATCNWRRRRWSRPSAGERGRGGRVVPPGGAAAANGEATSRPRRKKKERNAWPPSKRKEEIVAAGWAH